MKVHGKIIALTGAGNGIGRELALELLRRGAAVAALDKNSAFLEETRHLAGDLAVSLFTLPVDVTDRAAVAKLPLTICARFGTIDGLINCAGIIQPFAPLQELDDATIQRVFDVNLFGKLNMTRAFLPHLLQRSVAHIVNIASMGGVLPIPGQSIYGASKAAVKLMTEALDAELAGTRVRVTLVLPGMIETNITENSNVTKPGSAAKEKRRSHVLTASRAAVNILDGVEKDRHRVLVDTPARLLESLYRLAPRFTRNLIARQMKDMLAPNAK